MGNISNNEIIEKREAKAKIKFEHALVIGFNVISVDSLERKTTVEPLAIRQMFASVIMAAFTLDLKLDCLNLF